MLDTGANVYLTHHPPSMETDTWQDVIRLATGTGLGHCCSGPKGISQMKATMTTDGDNIDLLPLTWLWRRGCHYTTGDDHLLTPKGTSLPVVFCDDIPYISPQSVRRLFKDLPNASAPGRDGKPAACAVVVARASKVHTRQVLQHLAAERHCRGW